jgi:hypothetical protein
MGQSKVAPITKRGLLQKHYEMACHNLLCYSRNHLMDQAKEGFDTEWKQCQAECELLQEMINELPDGCKNEFLFTGIVSGWEVGFSEVNKEQFIKCLIVSDKEGNYRMFTVNYEAGKELMRVYDIERHNRYDEGKNTDIIFTISNFAQCVERWEWKVK